MKRTKLLIIILLASISSFFFANNTYAYVKGVTSSLTNSFTIKPTSDVTISYYAVHGGIKTKIKTTETITYNTSYNLNLNSLISNMVNYDDVEYYIDNTLYTNTNYSVIKDTNLEIDVIYTTTTFNKIYINLDESVFTGSNHLDTGIEFQTLDTLDKDYDIVFDIVVIDDANKTSGQTQPTIMNAKDEDNNMYPGNVVRLNTNSIDPVQLSGRWNNSRVTKNFTNTDEVIHVIVQRRGGIVKGRATSASNDTGTFTLYNQANWQINQYTNNTITFGARQYNGSYDRYFIGTLENIQVLLYE